MAFGIPGNKSTYCNPEVAEALFNRCKEETKKLTPAQRGKLKGEWVAEASVINDALRAHLKLDK